MVRPVALPLKSPLMPQLARSRASLPQGDGWAYEPKWDGFRAIAFVDGDETRLQSRNGRDLTRYFPELQSAPGRTCRTARSSSGDAGREDFDLLGQRIHPAEVAGRRCSPSTRPRASSPSTSSRATTTSSSSSRYLERRAALEALVADPIELTPRRATRRGGRALAAGGARASSPRSPPRPTSRASASAW